MKYVGFFCGIFLLLGDSCFALTVADVKISVTSDSPTAREKAIEEAHSLAFQKLLKEHFPEISRPLPSQTSLMNMVTDFSIDREKTTPHRYTASLTFQFDESQVQAWLHQDPSPKDSSSSQPLPLKKEVTPLKLTISYNTLPEWQHIKKTLERLPGAQKVNVIALSSKNAEIELTYREDATHLQQQLRQQNLILTQQGKEWVLSSDSPAFPSKASY